MRDAVHALKYSGVDAVAVALAGALVDLLPSSAAALVPIPRVVARRTRYGSDPGRMLARAVGRRTGIPVVEALRAPWFTTSQVRRRRASGAPFILCRPLPDHSVLVDDVLTTGATLLTAWRACAGATTDAVTVTRSAHA